MQFFSRPLTCLQTSCMNPTNRYITRFIWPRCCWCKIGMIASMVMLRQWTNDTFGLKGIKNFVILTIFPFLLNIKYKGDLTAFTVQVSEYIFCVGCGQHHHSSVSLYNVYQSSKAWSIRQYHPLTPAQCRVYPAPRWGMWCSQQPHLTTLKLCCGKPCRNSQLLFSTEYFGRKLFCSQEHWRDQHMHVLFLQQKCTHLENKYIFYKCNILVYKTALKIQILWIVNKLWFFFGILPSLSKV